MLRKQIKDQGVPPVPEFLDHLVESGAELWACKMSVDMMELTMDDMHDGVSDIINVTSFMELSDDAHWKRAADRIEANARRKDVILSLGGLLAELPKKAIQSWPTRWSKT